MVGGARRGSFRRACQSLFSASTPTRGALHAAQAGTDAGNVWFRAVSIGLIGVLTALTIFRILYHPPKRSVGPLAGARPAAPVNR